MLVVDMDAPHYIRYILTLCFYSAICLHLILQFLSGLVSWAVTFWVGAQGCLYTVGSSLGNSVGGSPSKQGWPRFPSWCQGALSCCCELWSWATTCVAIKELLPVYVRVTPMPWPGSALGNYSLKPGSPRSFSLMQHPFSLIVPCRWALYHCSWLHPQGQW